MFKKEDKWYISGKIKKDDGTYYSYTKLAQGCKLQKEAKEYERLFRLQYQEIQVSVRNKTFKEVANEMLNENINIKSSSKIANEERLRKVCPFIGSKKINLITKDHLRSMTREFEKSILNHMWRLFTVR